MVQFKIGRAIAAKAERASRPQPAQPRIERRWDCVHRGEKLRKEPCHKCGRDGQFEQVYSCGLWGECTIREFKKVRVGEAMPEVCMQCKTRVPPDGDKAKEMAMLAIQDAGGGFHGQAAKSAPTPPAEKPKRTRAERIAARNARIAARKARQGDRAAEVIEAAKVPAEAPKGQTKAERIQARLTKKERKRRERLALGGVEPPLQPPLLTDDPLVMYDRDGTKIGHVLRNMWAGCAAFYVCGGPSLREIDLSFLKDRGIVSLGINNVAGYAPVRAWTFSDPALKFSSDIFLDPAILKLVPLPKLGERIRARRDGKFAWTPYEVKHCPSVFAYNRQTLFDPETFLTSEQASWGRSKKHKVNEKKTTVLFTFLLGLRLLHYLGVRRVYLLGVDFKMTETAHYAFGQDRHPGAVASNNNSYAVATELCTELRPVFDKAGFEVYQTNPKSALRVFDYVPLEQAIEDCRGVIPKEPWPEDNLQGWYEKADVDGGSDDRGE